MEYYPAIKKKEILPSGNGIDEIGGHYAKGSKRVTDR